MATDLQMPYVAQALTADGGSDGRLTVASTANLRKGARVLLRDNTNDAVELEITKIVDATHVEVKDPSKIGSFLYDCSAYVITGMSPPVNDTFTTAGTGGTLPDGDYYYRVTAVNYLGNETLPSVETNLVISAGTATQIVTVKWAAVAGAVKYKIYGRTTGAELYMATVSAGTLEWVDDGSVTPAGALPVSNGTVNSAILTQNKQTDMYARTWTWF